MAERYLVRGLFVDDRALFRPIARAQILNRVRPNPALTDGFLYVRNETSLICLDLRRQ